MGKLDERVAVVTGAAMGNGEGVARVMAGHGARVVLWDISDTVFETAAALQSKGHEVSARKVDVRSYPECESAAVEVGGVVADERMADGWLGVVKDQNATPVAQNELFSGKKAIDQV